MANTYTQLHVQLIFAVADQSCLIDESNRDRIEKYICGIVKGLKSKPIAIYCNPDHCHLLVGLHPGIAVSDIARMVKAHSSKWVNENRLTSERFHWQEGYGAITYGRGQLQPVIQYILNQPEHHRKKTFTEEYIEFLKSENITFDRRYIFKSID